MSASKTRCFLQKSLPNNMPLPLDKYFEDFDSLEEAHRAYLGDLGTMGGDSFAEPSLALRLAIGLQAHVDLINQAFAQGYTSRDFLPQWRTDAKVFVGDARKCFAA